MFGAGRRGRGGGRNGSTESGTRALWVHFSSRELGLPTPLFLGGGIKAAGFLLLFLRS